MFGRPVTGAVMAGQVKKDAKPALVVVEKGGRMSDDAVAAPAEPSKLLS
jgi:hypothetical protein